MIFVTRREYSFWFGGPGRGGEGGDIELFTGSGAELSPTNQGRLATSAGEVVFEIEPSLQRPTINKVSRSPIILADCLLAFEVSSARSRLLA